MPSFIMKVTPDQDLYVEWSTVVDNIVWGPGTREELVKHGQFSGWFRGSSQMADIEARIARADETGTSAQYFDTGPQEGAWEDERMLVTNDSKRDGDFWLNRSDLGAYAAGDSSVLEFIPDDEED